MMATNRRRLMTAKEVADYLGLALDTVLKMSRDGRLPSVRVGSRTLRFRPETIDEYIASRERGNSPQGKS